MQILVVEDDDLLARGLVRALQMSGYGVVHAADGVRAGAELANQDFHAVLLDLGLPDVDGVQLLRKMRQQRVLSPVLVLTARDGVEQRVRALDAGADDYLEKPFDLREVEARLRALLRRAHTEYDDNIALGTLLLNPFERSVRLAGQTLALPAREYEVLELLMTCPGQTVSKTRIAQRLMAGNEDIGDNAVEVYVHRLRRRFAAHGVAIRTVRGVGYLIEAA